MNISIFIQPTHIYKHMYAHLILYIFKYICIYASVRSCTYTYMNIHAPIHTYTSAYTHVCKCIHIQLHVLRSHHNYYSQQILDSHKVFHSRHILERLDSHWFIDTPQFCIGLTILMLLMCSWLWFAMMRLMGLFRQPFIR